VDGSVGVSAALGALMNKEFESPLFDCEEECE